MKTIPEKEQFAFKMLILQPTYKVQTQIHRANGVLIQRRSLESVSLVRPWQALVIQEKRFCHKDLISRRSLNIEIMYIAPD